jgi:putative transposase
MPRVARSRLVEPGSLNHCCWQTHDHQRLFEVGGAREKFLELLARHKSSHGILIHAYCIMGTHPHVLCTATQGQERFSAFWKVVNHGFARWLNRRLGRSGQVVMERLGSPRVQPAPDQVLRTMRYADRNPVEAGLVKSPKDWAWSSYAHYALGADDPLVDDAPAYLLLGRTAAERRLAYQHLAHVAPDTRDPDDHRNFPRRPFIGEAVWVRARYVAAGLDPPG